MVTTNKNNQTNETIVVDEALVRELDLWAQNTSEIYFQKHIPFVKNYRKKQEKGIYQEDLALKGILNNYVPVVIESYRKEFGPNTLTKVSKTDKIALAKELLQNVLDDIKAGVE
jgi:hypothetical protein